MAREGTLFILVGPSGAGKNTLMKQVQARVGDLKQLATYTTRSPREGEEEGVQHHFVTDEEFNCLVEQGDFFVEYQNVHLNNFYGTPRGPIEQALDQARDLIADIDFLGAAEVRRAYPENTAIIFVTPPSLESLAERIRRRGPITDQELAGRLERARYELTYALQCDYMVVNDVLDKAIDNLFRIVTGERNRRSGIPGIAPVPRHKFHGQVMAAIERNGRVLVRIDQTGDTMPVFEHEERNQRPDVTLSVRMEDALGFPVSFEPPRDNRINFPPPRYVTLTEGASAFTLRYYYRCFLPLDAAVPERWSWRPVEQLALPGDVRAHLFD